MLLLEVTIITTGARHHLDPRVSSSHRFFGWRCRSLPLAVTVLCVLLLPFSHAFPCIGDRHWVSYDGSVSVQDSFGHDNVCASNDEGIGLLDDEKGSSECAWLKHVCFRSDSFCFLATFRSLFDKQDKCGSSYLGASVRPFDFRGVSDVSVYRLSDRKKVTCSLMNADSNEIINQNDVNHCAGPFPPNSWIRGSGGMTTTPDQLSIQIDSTLGDSSSSPNVEINPPLIDWGSRNLYSPSCALLTVANRHKDSILHVYKPYSTDPQFYLKDFQELSISPGKSASISFVFLPRHLGYSSAQIVLQTSYGGFIIHAKGIAIESFYRIQPLVEFSISENGRLCKDLSLYNPFNGVLYVEEVSVLISVVYGNVSHSSRIFCRSDTLQQSLKDISPKSHGKHSHVKGVGYGLPNLVIRPKRKWKISPHDKGVILEVSLVPHVKGNVSGVIYMKLQNPSQNEIKTVMVPLEAKLQHKVGHYALVGLVSVFLEPFMTHDGKDPIYLLSLRNDGSSLLQLLKVSEVTDSKNMFNIRYAEGLLLYPESLTSIAFITDISAIDSWDLAHEIPCRNLNCNIQIVTNESASQIEIPCTDLIYACSRHEHSSPPVSSKDSSIRLSPLHEELTDERTTPSGSVLKENLSKQSNILEVAEADELILRNWKYQGSMIEMSVLDDHELLFPLVEVGTHCSKWINVKNPSQKPVVMQLLLSSGSLVDHCKSAFEVSDHITNRFSRINSTSDGFSLGNSAIIEALIHPFEKAAFGPIIFHPSNRCMWRSLALIRNNLSGVEWLPLQGVGGSHSLLVLEDSKPIQKLEFNVNWVMPFNISYPWSIFLTEHDSATCDHLLSKELLVKNMGELRLEVLKLEVSGGKCGLDGFRIHTCKAFALAPGESTKLHISYKSDFSSDITYRDLEIALASGIIVIPMKANISICMMKICRKSIILSLAKMTPLLIFFAFLVTAFLFFLPATFSSTSEDYKVKTKSTMATITKAGKSHVHQGSRNFRWDREDTKSKASNVGRYRESSSSSKQKKTRNIGSKQDYDYQEKVGLVGSFSEAKSSDEPGGSSGPETSQIGNLTVRILKGRRRKRRASGAAGSTTKPEISSSQSGNSAPSSPSTPNALTPKEAWPMSPKTLDHRVVAERNQDKVKAPGRSSNATNEPAAINCHHDAWKSVVAHEWPSVTSKPTTKPVLLPSATFPSSGCRPPGAAAPQQFVVTASPIAPHARAPGSKVGKDGTVSRDKQTLHGKDFTYDIWGNHFADHIMGRCKELSPRPFSDASEGDSLSFFARGPQSLVTMSSARSASPVRNPHAYDVNCNQMV